MINGIHSFECHDRAFGTMDDGFGKVVPMLEEWPHVTHGDWRPDHIDEDKPAISGIIVTLDSYPYLPAAS